MPSTGVSYPRLYEICRSREELTEQASNCLSSEIPMWKGGLWLAPGTQILGGIPPFPGLRKVAHCALTVYTDNTVYAQHLLSLRSSEFSYLLEKGCLCDQPAIETWALSN